MHAVVWVPSNILICEGSEQLLLTQYNLSRQTPRPKAVTLREGSKKAEAAENDLLVWYGHDGFAWSHVRKH